LRGFPEEEKGNPGPYRAYFGVGGGMIARDQTPFDEGKSRDADEDVSPPAVVMNTMMKSFKATGFVSAGDRSVAIVRKGSVEFLSSRSG